MPHLAGKKIAKSHSTITESAGEIIKLIQSHPLVTKIVTGEIKVIKAGPTRIKITRIPAGLQLMIRGHNSRQKIFLYTGDPKTIENIIKNKTLP